MKKSEIKFTVSLDERNHPESISWKAEASGVEGEKPCKSLMIALWDSPDNGTLRIDLWTKKMMVEEMQRFFYETLVSMADTFHRATNDETNSEFLRQFAKEFGQKTGVLKIK